jgi:cell wall-associated NlpC family hydrolase
MTTYSADEIYGFARAAGFSADQATTMTAIALAESGGHGDAHATSGEDSRGLWQINMAAHATTFGSVDLYDPISNAKAAYEVSNHGQDISPWTTTHGDANARYITFESQAHAAAAAYGDPSNLGVWSGTDGYGHHLAAGGDGGLPAHAPTTFDLTDDAQHHVDPTQAHGATADGDHFAAHSVEGFLVHALAQDGDKYVFGHEVDLNDHNPNTFDCSELVQWAAHQAGVDVADGSWLQYAQAHTAGTTMTVADALHTPGALLFSFSSDPLTSGGRPEHAHVAISLGDGRTIEANSPKNGVGIFSAGKDGARFQYAASIPGLDYANAHALSADQLINEALHPQDVATLDTTHTVADHLATDHPPADLTTTPVDAHPIVEPAPAPAPVHIDPNSPDTDHDGLTDSMEAHLGTDAHNVDTDHDGLSDAYEVAVSHTDPLHADSDHDGLSDSMELALGLDPNSRDTDHDGHLDSEGYFADGPDSDHDGLSDALEAILGTASDHIDSDGDGFSDAIEFQAGSDPLNADMHPDLQAAGLGGGGDLHATHSVVSEHVDDHHDLQLATVDTVGVTHNDPNAVSDDD